MAGLEIYPIGVEGLAKILFPSGISGFEKPSSEKPKSVLITGAPGAGKTILATQMLFGMAKKGANCSFVTTRDNADILKNIALTFGFCTERFVEDDIDRDDYDDIGRCDNNVKNIKLPKSFKFPSIRIRQVPSNTYLNLFEDDNNIIDAELKMIPEVLFVDSLNVTNLHLYEKRDQIKAIFNRINEHEGVLSIILLEDYKESGTEGTRELIKDCEFLTDIVVDLTNYKGKRYVEVKKKHYGSHFGGKHYYDICQKHHHLSNIGKNIPSGIVVYPSIARFLKESQIDPYYEPDPYSGKDSFNPKNKVHTGITHLDSMLTYSPGKKDKVVIGKSIEKNACVVISGKRGNHKLAFGLNLLIGGLWEPVKDEREKIIRAEASQKNVLVTSLDEPTNLPIDDTALAYNTHETLTKNSIFRGKKLDNGDWIRWRHQTMHPKCHPARTGRKAAEARGCLFSGIIDDEQTGRNDHKSIFLNNWCAYTGVEGVDDAEGNKEKFEEAVTGCNALIVASYRPGYITPDEFLYSISRLIELEGTTPELYEEVEIREDIFEIRMPSIGKPAKEIFNLLKNNELIIEKKEADKVGDDGGTKNGDRKKYKLNIEKYTPEYVWGLLKAFEREREAIIFTLNDYKRKKVRFSRVLFHSTAFLQNRFPSLYKEPLFLTALADFLKSKNIMSIFINNTDDGHDEKISHGVLSAADYIIELENANESKGTDHSWSRLAISNAKAKSYVQTPHYISVQPKEGHNELVMSNEIGADSTGGNPSNSTNKPWRIIDIMKKTFKKSSIEPISTDR
jgi:KaiC/GvpD/RAD55 family RecA-like ATPase